MIGFPSLAATSMEQGRLAALAAFDRPAQSLGAILPYGIYSIPELSFVGPTERELTDAAVPYVVGLGRYRELARGEIAGDRTGLLKLLVHARTRQVLGVHIFGTSATELVHVGQTVMAGGLTVDYLVDAVFNVPTFCDAYKVAALDAANRLNELARPRLRPGGVARSGVGARAFSRRRPSPHPSKGGANAPTLYCRRYRPTCHMSVTKPCQLRANR